jgi:putative aldouronate transport system permease protein
MASTDNVNRFGAEVEKRERRAPRGFRRSFGSHAFDAANYAFLLLFCLATIYPFVNIISLSFTSERVLNVGYTAALIPPEFSIAAYVRVLSSKFIRTGYLMTILRTVIGTILSVIVTLTTAYPLSKRYFPHRRFWIMMITFTMLFSGGLIPTYLLVRNLGLMNSLGALILPGLVNTFNFIVVRNYLLTVPESLEESARIDGANDLLILFRIILPLSLPIVATISLWVAVWHWNAWFDSLIYTTKQERLVLQVVLRRVIMEGSQMVESVTAVDDMYRVSTEKIKAATIVVTTLPILLAYPFAQKYFIKGIIIGSLKE